MSEGITAKQQLFVEAYLDCLNAAAAARRAGYSARTARQQGQRLLTHVDIAEAVRVGLAERAMPAEEVLARLSEQARGDASDFLTIYESPLRDDLTGEPILDQNDQPVVRYFPSLDLRKAKERGVLHLIKKVSYTAHGPSVEFYDAQSALALLGKHHLLFNDTTLNIDMSRLSDEQVDRLAAGESLATVIRTTKKDAAPDSGGS